MSGHELVVLNLGCVITRSLCVSQMTVFMMCTVVRTSSGAPLSKSWGTTPWTLVKKETFMFDDVFHHTRGARGAPEEA